MLKFSRAFPTAVLSSALLLGAFSQPATAQIVVATPPPAVVVAPAVAPQVVVAAPPTVVVVPRPRICSWERRREPDNGFYGWHWHNFRVCH